MGGEEILRESPLALTPLTFVFVRSPHHTLSPAHSLADADALPKKLESRWLEGLGESVGHLLLRADVAHIDDVVFLSLACDAR